jgi:predicted small lipoprotein YifL
MVEDFRKEKIMTNIFARLLAAALLLSALSACGVRGDPVAPSVAKKQESTQN